MSRQRIRIAIAKKISTVALSLTTTALAVSAVALSCASAANATPTWLSSTNLSATNQSSQEGRIAVTPGGEAVSVWQTADGHEVIQVSVKPAPGSWQTPVTLSETSLNAYHPQVAIDPQGEAIAVWQIYDGSHFIIQSSVRPAAGGSWQTPVTLSETSNEAYSPTIALDPSGEAIAAWVLNTGSHSFVQASARATSSSSWQTPVTISETSHMAYEPQLVINSHGEALAMWQLETGSAELAQVAARPASGSWQTPVTLSPTGHGARQAHVALNDEGEAIASWAVEISSKEDVQTSIRSGPSASWTTPVTQGEGEPSMASAPQHVAIDARGDAIVIWSVLPSGGSYETVTAAVKPGASAAWQTPVTLAGGAYGSRAPDVAFDDNGEALAVWSHNNGSYTGVQASLLASPTGSWTAAQTISESSGSAYSSELAVEPRGNAIALWTLYGSHQIIQASSLIAAGPELESLSVPASGEVGESLSFSVNPLDTWASLGQTEWSFGDGEHEIGTSASHTYAHAGSYEVEVKSEDVFGNATTEKRTLVIEEPPATEPPEPPPSSESGSHEPEAPAHKTNEQQNTQEVASVIQTNTASTPTTSSTPTATPRPVVTAPALELLTKAPQPLINTHALTLKVACGERPCSAGATGWVKLPGRHRRLRLKGSPATIAAESTGKVALAVPRRLRRAVRKYLIHHPHYEVKLHLTVILTANGHPSESVRSTLPIWTYPGFR